MSLAPLLGLLLGGCAKLYSGPLASSADGPPAVTGDARAPATAETAGPFDAGGAGIEPLDAASTNEPDAGDLETVGDGGTPCDTGSCRLTAVRVALNGLGACAVLSDRTVGCWGVISAGRPPLRFEPIAIKDAVDITMGASHGCALISDGSISCWGKRSNALGDGGTYVPNAPALEPLEYERQWKIPVKVVGASGATALTAGQDHNCGLFSGGSVRCWGWNADGQLGDGTRQDASVPVTVQGLSGVIALSAGGYHNCAVLSAGGVVCWGSNTGGQLGNGRPAPDEPSPFGSTPAPVKGLSGAKDVAAGYQHTCVRFAEGTVRCWGDGRFGQLGTGTTTDSPLPVAVPGLQGVRMLAVGMSHTCALLLDGVVQCWGLNGSGELGIGNERRLATSPTVVPGFTGATRIAAQWSNTCAVFADGSLRCTGTNSAGQLGRGSRGEPALTPVTVAGF